MIIVYRPWKNYVLMLAQQLFTFVTAKPVKLLERHDGNLCGWDEQRSFAERYAPEATACKTGCTNKAIRAPADKRF